MVPGRNILRVAPSDWLYEKVIVTIITPSRSHPSLPGWRELQRGYRFAAARSSPVHQHPSGSGLCARPAGLRPGAGMGRARPRRHRPAALLSVPLSAPARVPGPPRLGAPLRLPLISLWVGDGPQRPQPFWAGIRNPGRPVPPQPSTWNGVESGNEPFMSL